MHMRTHAHTLYMSAICLLQVGVPAYASDAVRDVILGLLHQNPQRRRGGMLEMAVSAAPRLATTGSTGCV